MPRPTHLDDLWPGDLVLVIHGSAEIVTTGFVVGDPLTGAAIQRMPMKPPWLLLPGKLRAFSVT